MPVFYRYHSPAGGGFFQGAVKKLVLINVGVFILQLLLIRTPFEYFFALYPRLVIARGYIWQLVTYMFLHGGIMHLALNMFIIWMFGTPLERLWGSTRFLRYYFVCGLGGAAFSFIFAFNTAVIGASGAGYGILLAYAVLFPYNELYVWGIFPMRARTLVIVLAIIEFISGISGGTGIAHFAHLGGMAAGLVYLRANFRTQRIRNALKGLFDKFPIKVKFGDDSARRNDRKANTGSENIDSILDKISSKGYENLSETEKRILENYTDRDTNH
jgi:membrane associated rhomboid family serine protease